jgi:hypothetical protein
MSLKGVGKIYDLTKELHNAINVLDRWLSTQKDDARGIIEETRKNLYQIQTKGYYTEKEKDLLNTIRAQYYIEKEESKDDLQI